MMECTGTMEWNTESNCNGVLRLMRTWYHLSTYNNNIIEVLGLWGCIIRILSRGRWAQGIEALLSPGHELAAGIYGYFIPLGNTAIKYWGACDIQVQWQIQDF